MPMIPIETLRDLLLRANARWTPKATPLATLSDADRRRRLGLLDNEPKRQQEAAQAAQATLHVDGLAARAALPGSVDWRDRGGVSHVTAVKDQGNCGSCVSFCVAAVVESAVSIEHGRQLDLSEADLHFCSSHGASCDGWWPGDAIDQVKSRGITADAEFPYASAFSGGEPRCITSIHRDVNAVRLVEKQVLYSFANRRFWLANVGPVSAAMEVFSDFYSYGSGVYEHKTGSREGLHCVQVIGYSDAEGCWICKNSWGTGWGDNGFFKIAYGACRIDTGNPGLPPPAGPQSLGFLMQGVRGTVLLPEFKVPGQASKAAPALAVFAGQLHMVHLGGSSNRLWHSVNNGDSWTPNVLIAGQLSKAAPALATRGPAQLHMVHLGDTSNDLWHSMFDGSRWSTNVRIPGQKSKASPALTDFRSTVCMVHLGDSSNDLWHSFFNGSQWSTNVRIDQKSKATPALAVFNGRVHMVHLGDSANDLWHSTFDGNAWTPNVRIAGQLSKASPALAVFGGRLHMVHLGNTSNDIWHSVFDGSVWSTNVRLPLKKSMAAPALADFAGHLQMLHIGDTETQLWQGWVA